MPSVRNLMPGLGTCLAYLITGALGLTIAIKPSFASLLWLPAGIALGMTLQYGRRALYGVFLGSCLLHVYIAMQQSPDWQQALHVPLLIGLGAALQAQVGAWLVRRLIGHPLKLHEPGQVIRFLLLTGPLASVVNGLIGPLTMLAAGRIDASQLGGTLFTWWLGDTLGVILVLPLMLVLFKPLRESWMPPIRRVAVPLLVISLVALAAFRAISHNEQQHQQSTFVQFAEVQRRSLQASLDSAVDALHALRGFVQTTPQITPSTFERFTRELLGFNPGLQGLSWNPVVGLEERAGFEQRMQQLHGSPFMLTERGPTGGLVRAAERPRYVVAAFVEPAQQNRAALGFDVLSIPSRESALRQALDSGRPVPTTALRLVTETDGQASVLVFLPVFADGPADGSAPDWQQLRGFATLALRLGDLAQQSIGQAIPAKTAVALLDPEAPGKRRLLFSGGDGFAPAELEQAVAGNDLPILVRSEVRLGERAWELVQYARNDFIETPWALFYLLSGGFLLSGVYCWLILVLAGQRNHVQLQVAEQTRQLAISNSLLAEAKRIAGLSHWVWYPREQRHHWSVPFCKLIGDDELGARASVEAFVARLLPHCQEEVAARIGFWVHGRGASSQPLVCELAPVAGRRRHIELQSDWIQNDQGEAEYLSIVAQDITERWQGQEQLRLAAATFEGQDAILITDVQGDIRRVNGAFERLLGYPQSLVQGRNPRIFRTGRHDHDFYRRLWQRVAERGYWQGEIWNLHRDGSERLLRASITAVKGASGSTSHYVASYSDITDQRQAEEQIRRLAYYDSLTGLPNRDLFHENLRQQIAQGRRGGHFGALLFIDLDNFKSLNDTLGHSVGDVLLRDVTGRLRDGLREQDIIGRFGGDEFLILLPCDCDSAEQAQTMGSAVAAKVIVLLQPPFQFGSYSHRVSASVGMTLVPQDDSTPETLIMQADTAMYHAKGMGKGRFSHYQADMQAELVKQVKLDQELRQALQQRELELHYQPQFDQRRSLVGAEALVRWRHPERGLLLPGAFLRVAEEAGLMGEIGEWVLDEAIAQLSRWDHDGLCLPRLSINICPSQLSDDGFIDRLDARLAGSGLAPQQICIELTEQVLLPQASHVHQRVEMLRDRGYAISIDDFGTGYSSLNYLKKLPVAELKIAREFVKDIPEGRQDSLLVKTILNMARNLGVDVIAEGVERIEQYEYLCQLGCPRFQGYYLARPMPAAEFARQLRSAYAVEADTACEIEVDY